MKLDSTGKHEIAHLLPRLDLLETSSKELGDPPGNLTFVTLPVVVRPQYKLVVFGVRDILNLLAEPFRRNHLVFVSNNEQSWLAIFL